MPTTRAVLFDFGGTLYDYGTLERANRESLVALANWAGIDADADLLARAHRDALRRVFNEYLPRPFYLHEDLFRDTLLVMFEALGSPLEAWQLERYQVLLRQAQIRDLALREGVAETLRSLRARGIVLGLVSNIDEEQLADLAEAGGIGPQLDWMLSSEKAGSCKPHPAIFEEALRRAGCAPHEALFVGDTLRQDVAGASRAGMRSVLLWHRDDRSPPDEEPQPDHVIRRITDLLQLAG